MNAQQRNYLTAKAAALAEDKQQAENEKQFIAESGVKNPDGTIPTALWKIENEEDFERLCERWDNHPLNRFEAVRTTAEALVQAEETLIDFALSIVPHSVANTLNNHRKDYSTRQEILDLAVRLDVSTI